MRPSSPSPLTSAHACASPARLAALSIAAAMLSACGPSPPAPTEARILGESEIVGERALALQRATEARDALFNGLLGELTRALDQGGPSAAIGVCKDRAPALALEVSAARGVRIGRTSHRLRNPGNDPPPWARKLIESRPESTVCADLGQEGLLGVLLPIRLGAPCVSCHGEAEKLAPGVKEALAQDYPKDQATGFRTGDLRGWFWVEARAPGKDK